MTLPRSTTRRRRKRKETTWRQKRATRSQECIKELVEDSGIELETEANKLSMECDAEVAEEPGIDLVR